MFLFFQNRNEFFATSSKTFKGYPLTLELTNTNRWETHSQRLKLIPLERQRNLNFHKLGASSQWYERFQGLHRNHSIHAFNQHDTSTLNQLYGGTAQIAMGPCSHWVLASGSDPSGLGWWVWTLFAGCNNTKLRVISGYRPNPDLSDQTGSVYSQQERYLCSIKDD